MKNILSAAISIAFLCFSCNDQEINIENTKAEIEHILQIQETAYNERNDPDRIKKMAATCEDSLIFIGGDDGGLATSANAYTHDLADGYTIKPHDRTFRIYGNTVIVTSLHQAYKLFGKDTLYLNVRSSKIFIKNGATWKMAYTTYAPLPVIYTKPANIDAAKYAEYTGLYKSDPAVTDTIIADDKKLYVSSTGSPRSELIPVNDSIFIGEGYFGKTGFYKDPTGKVQGYYFEWNDGQRLYFPRLK